MLAGKPSGWANSTFARTTLPMFGFVVFAWWGLSQLMESKLQIRHGARGYDKVEEYDPIERMKRLATGPAVDSMPSIEDELKAIHSKVDIHKFDYKPVPRTDNDDEE
jgi:cytochrome c oxidase assembly protein subunit 16